ncbi:hypothetical protein [Hymenobacter sp. B81]|uniref:hypothetical protein n=1 Tax=Hymenobacter sp. B81 TaxID=3344878 RepID=UPI0037DD2E29
MSRSRRRNPILAVTNADSEKQNKRDANRVLRRKVRQGRLYLTLREVSNVWGFDKDGKHFQRSAEAKRMRK